MKCKIGYFQMIGCFTSSRVIQGCFSERVNGRLKGGFGLGGSSFSLRIILTPELLYFPSSSGFAFGLYHDYSASVPIQPNQWQVPPRPAFFARFIPTHYDRNNRWMPVIVPDRFQPPNYDDIDLTSFLDTPSSNYMRMKLIRKMHSYIMWLFIM